MSDLGGQNVARMPSRAELIQEARDMIHISVHIHKTIFLHIYFLMMMLMNMIIIMIIRMIMMIIKETTGMHHIFVY